MWYRKNQILDALKIYSYKRGGPLFLESEKITCNFRTIKNIIRHYIVISVPCVIILKETSGKA